ncbi:hypothetical protein [Paracraurococcus lichenis]|uniref:Uncharacterized protein n=1 Tax=Paracraurococcus lichenis TaxID=3064888 RepID=A0ABT9E6X8_9PROT|nr:hypothetical protein [Paracraurococcus sp. LOR1-02]MDO9711918.1 hypothetical protein [Paracraurococcus sp. LOR1-02]
MLFSSLGHVSAFIAGRGIADPGAVTSTLALLNGEAEGHDPSVGRVP